MSWQMLLILWNDWLFEEPTLSLEVTGELAFMKSMHGKTTGKIEIKKMLIEYNLK